MSYWKNNEEIEIFREYLRIPSVHPDINYTPCVEFLQRQAASLGLPVKVFYPGKPNRPIVCITWVGTQPVLPSVMLNSHMDVVPVFPEKWTHPPFAADMDAEGRIFARGSQDMKCVGMQYLATIRALKKSGVALKRTIHVTFVPEEEVGGHEGMGEFVKTEEFKKLNVGFSLDEGYASPNNNFNVFYAERTLWQIKFKFNGAAGHGSLLLKNTPGEKLNYVVNKLMTMRQQEVNRLEKDPHLTVSDVTTINLTVVHGGVQNNVIPPQMEACFDMRLAIDLDVCAFEKEIHKWCEEAGGDVEVEFVLKEPKIAPTRLDNSNPFWSAFKQATDELGMTVNALVLPGATDNRYVRGLGIPAIGFSPMNNTPILLHDHDEYITAETYLRGVEIYKKIILAVANV